jgi:hypothetical protein
MSPDKEVWESLAFAPDRTDPVQRRLRESYTFVLLGRGPSATGRGPGWNMSRGLFFRCSRCDYLMPSDTGTTERCTCGALNKDADAGRFGSHLGDDAIEVYEARPKVAP